MYLCTSVHKGAMKRSAETAKAGTAAANTKVGVSIIEAFSKTVEPQELESVLRIEYRSKMLNPKWATAMAAQGSGGAYEISQRMTALIGKHSVTRIHSTLM
jgi:magnesium chelatase subunit H